ncbi:MAG: hypothetical protein GWO08_09975, partial [Gammaproteobacteria bacterium]|nr:hypothetical protein [Gammaproteobacteria bacterium]NIT55520.1 hypothetical protein [Fodinibius sp.]NIX57746.1 hypothetical protein [candidate division Zixibacteria bacterium]NIY24104.1 hypothetical protein [Fodinibius sp.]
VHGKGYVWIPPWQELKPGYAYWGKLYKSKKFIWSGKENFREYVYFEGFNLASGDYTFNPLTETHECGTLKIWITLGTCTYDTKYSSTQTDNDGNKSYGIPPVVVYGFDLESGGYVQPNVLEPGRGYWTLWHDPDLPIKLEVKK